MTIPVAALGEAGLHPGDEVLIEALKDGELRIRRGADTIREVCVQVQENRRNVDHAPSESIF